MSRKWMVWIVAPVLLTVLTGCPKKKPKTPPQDLNVETKTVPAPPPAPTQEVTQAPPPAPVVEDKREDPLLSQDLQVVNDELRRRGFSPDVYFELDESSLSDDARGKL